MPNVSDLFSYLFSAGFDVLNATVDPTTGAMLLQIGDSTAQTVDSDGCELWQQSGFASMPQAPVPGQSGCQGIAIKRGDRDLVFATRDVRAANIYGNLAMGETCVYAAGSQARTVYKADGSITHITTDDNTATGNSVLSRTTPTEERFWAPFGKRWHDVSGFHVRTWHGAKFDLGGLGLPAPFNIYSSMAALSADVVHIDAAVLSLGRDNGFCQAVVQATPLAKTMANVSTAMSDVSTALTAIAAVPAAVGVAPSATPAVASALLALTSAISAMTTALVAISAPSSAGAGTATNTTIA
jgi:hypothetical protein